MRTEAERTAFYSQRGERYQRERDRQVERSGRIARARLVTFVAAAGCVVWSLGLAGGVLAGMAALLLFGLFGALVVVHAKVEERVSHLEALVAVNRRGAASIARNWDALPDALAPDPAAIETHPYAVDLDLFGRASLFQLLGPAATATGRSFLARWILEPAEPKEIRARQEAVAELARLDDWRERLAALGHSGLDAHEESLDRFLAWAEAAGDPLPAYRVLRAAVYAIIVLAWVPLLLHVTGAAPNSAWSVPLLAGMILSFATAGRVSAYFDRAGAGERTLRRYASVFAHHEQVAFTSSRLTELQGALLGGRAPASAVMAQLNRLLGFAELRRGAAIFHFLIQLFTLWDFHCLFAMERWRRASGARVRNWFTVTGQADALACLGRLQRDNSEWTFPSIGTDRTYTASRLGHPLIAATRRVSNDVVVGPPGSVLLITGSNMSGKSTLLRAIGLNALLAQCGAPVCATSLTMPHCDLQTSIRIQDSLERGVSYFMAALARLKGVVEAAEREPHGRVLLYLLDEILQGTNSVERGIAVQGVARHLLAAPAIGAITTHDLNIAHEEPLRSAARLVHFSEVIDETGDMRFDYALRPGLATSRNALRLMKLIGIHVETRR